MTIKCSGCGRFIGYKEIEDDRIRVDYIPDSYYTSEEILWYHEECW
jgi:hypothetical protein